MPIAVNHRESGGRSTDSKAATGAESKQAADVSCFSLASVDPALSVLKEHFRLRKSSLRVATKWSAGSVLRESAILINRLRLDGKLGVRKGSVELRALQGVQTRQEVCRARPVRPSGA